MKVERMLATLAARRMKPLSMSIARASDAESIAPPSRNSKSLRSKGYVVELSRTFSFRSASVTFVLTSGFSPRMTS